MSYTIQFYGISKEIVGNALINIDKNFQIVADLRKYLQETYPSFKELKSFMIAVNESYAMDNQSITPNDIIAIIPPVSGG